MKLKIPPVVVMLLLGTVMWAFKYVSFTNIYYVFAGKWIIAASVFVVSSVVLVLSLQAFKKLKTSVDPLHPEKASNLVVIGIYKWSRNPMYFGMLLLLLSWGIVLANPLNLIIALAFYIYINEFQIKPEEALLQVKFGNAYSHYCSKVRRWI